MNSLSRISRKLLLNNRFILTLIVLNSLIIFVHSFDGLPQSLDISLITLDIILTLIFLLEILLKISISGWTNFYKDKWNKFDFYIVLFSVVFTFLPLMQLIQKDISFIIVLRVARAFKAFRFIKFIPDMDELIAGVKRALRASVLVIIVLVLYLFILAIFSTSLFKDLAPEYFSNPLKSLYSIFIVFTVEGWYEIPDAIIANSSRGMGIFATIYFIVVLFTGGILGLSLMNSIFVDSMVADNNDALEEKVEKLTDEIGTLSKKIDELNQQK